MKFNIFLDDVRNLIDPDWIIVRDIEHIKQLLNLDLVNNLSLDHDMGDNSPTGYDLICWMEENNKFPPGLVGVHSQNPVGAERMRRVLKQYNKLDEDGSIWESPTKHK